MPIWKKSKPTSVPVDKTGTMDVFRRDPFKLQRDLSPEFGGKGGLEWGADYYIRTICHVCRLQLFPEKEVPKYFPAAQYIDQVQYTTPGGLSLCKRHYDLVDDLIRRQVSVDKWPSQLIRGIVTLSRAYLQSGRDGVAVAEKTLGNIQTTKTVMTPAPIFGNTYYPANTYGGTGTFSYNFMAFPMQMQVVDQQAVNDRNWTQNYLQLSQQRVQVFSEQVAKYSEILDRVRRENTAKFVTCLRCGQSEMPLGTKVCTWCGQSQGYTGEAVPTPCLVEDVDPLGVVPTYLDRTGTAILGDVNGDKRVSSRNQGEKAVNQKEIIEDAFCINCGAKISNPISNFCDNCGSPVEDRNAQKIAKKHDTKPGSVAPSLIKPSNEKATHPDPDEAIKKDPGSVKKEEKSVIDHGDTHHVSSTPDLSTNDPIKFCPECGKKLLPGEIKYCPYCGSKIPVTG